MRIVLDIPGVESLPLDEAEVTQLLRDAIGEFISNRTPTTAYVLDRYKGQSLNFISQKQEEVSKRIGCAIMLRRFERE